MDNRPDIKRIVPYITGKDVLDIGSTGGLTEETPECFDFIRSHAKTCVGIDIDEPMIEKRKKQGYDIRYGNAETFELKEKFDVITAFEVIEHLSNAGHFLSNAKKHLKEKGIIILETDNAYNIRWPTIVFFKGKMTICKEHVAIYDESCLTEQLRRAGFKPIAFEYFTGAYHNNASLPGNVIVFLSYLLGKVRKRMNETILCIGEAI